MFGGLLIAGRALGGFGTPSSCGTLGLDCLRNAIAWVFATQGLATVPLWLAVPRLVSRSFLKQICVVAALGSSLVFLAGCWVVVASWLERTT
ncbi:MAG: hypothetical protein EOO28_01865 [Comamonadaceae bacterium]|nr:MAG: hypothetical protein EOO28_01865 [Comamonadaceae bacterium]